MERKVPRNDQHGPSTWIRPFQFRITLTIIRRRIGPIEVHIQQLNPALQRAIHRLNRP